MGEQDEVNGGRREPDLPRLYALRAFEAAARHLHFAKAADELALTPTAISHQVKLLEGVLGCQLFIRLPRPMRLSPEGQALFPVLLDGLDRFAAAIGDLKLAHLQGPLVISVPHSFASRWLLPRIVRIREETGIDLAIEADDRMVDLPAGTVDCAVRCPTTPTKDVNAHALFQDRMIPVCTPEFLSRHGGAPKTAVALLRLPLIHSRWKTKRSDAPSWARWLIEAAKSEPAAATVPVDHGIKLSEETHGIEAALNGQGLTLASDIEVSLDFTAGRLIAPLDIAIPGLTFYLVCLRSHRRAGEVARLAEWMIAEAQRR